MLLSLFAPTSAEAQGYEVAVFGSPTAELGGRLRVGGIAYRVTDLAELSVLPNASIVAKLTRGADNNRRRVTVEELTVQTDREGRFEVALSAPDDPVAAPRLELAVRRGDEAGREFTWPVSFTSPFVLDLLTDRQLYQGGEDMRFWSRIRRVADGAPVADRTIRWIVITPDGSELVRREESTSAAGVSSISVSLPDGIVDGGYRVSAEVLRAGVPLSQARVVRVGRRTVERLLVEVDLDQTVVRPAQQFSGAVTVRSPSGTPVFGAMVELRPFPSAEPLRVTTNAEGVARFRTAAPGFMTGDTAPQMLSARVVHAAHGTLHVSKGYLLTRVDFRAEATPEAGGLVPELPTTAFVTITDPTGEPAPEGTELTVRGPAVRGGSVTLQTDAQGLVEVPMLVAAGAAGPLRGACAGRMATTVDIEIQTDRAHVTSVCVPVSPAADLLARVAAPIVPPGGTVEVEIARRPRVRGRPAVVEAMWRGRSIAWRFVPGNAALASLDLPAVVGGLVQLRVRAVTDERRTPAPTVDGHTVVGAGAAVGVLVRPADAFRLEMDPEQDTYKIQEQALLGLRTAPAQPGYVALVARDVAADGGETPFRLGWLDGALSDAVTHPSEEESERFLR
ncbi:MAG: hypothetical protein AAGF12_38135, partial [Myxococcota bacterium]